MFSDTFSKKNFDSVRALDWQIQWLISQLAEGPNPLNSAELLEMMVAVAPQVERVMPRSCTSVQDN